METGTRKLTSSFAKIKKRSTSLVLILNAALLNQFSLLQVHKWCITQGVHCFVTSLLLTSTKMLANEFLHVPCFPIMWLTSLTDKNNKVSSNSIGNSVGLDWSLSDRSLKEISKRRETIIKVENLSIQFFSISASAG